MKASRKNVENMIGCLNCTKVKSNFGRTQKRNIYFGEKDATRNNGHRCAWQWHYGDLSRTDQQNLLTSIKHKPINPKL